MIISSDKSCASGNSNYDFSDDFYDAKKALRAKKFASGKAAYCKCETLQWKELGKLVKEVVCFDENLSRYEG